MVRVHEIGISHRSAAFFSAALVMFLALGWMSVARAQAQTPRQIEGQLQNGTHDAPASSVADVPVTLFQITAAGPVTVTQQTDAEGNFSFTNVISDANAYFTRVDYAGLRYFSEILPQDVAGVNPITMTVYETQTLPANFTLERVHLILDVQPKRFNGLELVQVTNPGDRAFLMPLPIPDKTSDVQFQDIREETIVKRQEDGTILYPVLPTTTEILYGVVLPFTPPDYRLQIPLRTPVSGFSILVSKTSDAVITGSNLVAGAPFTSQSGQEYLVYSAPGQPAGASFSATLTNLPGADNTATLQAIALGAGGIGGLALLTYPLYRRRSSKKTAQVSERVLRLESLARLDDAFEEGKLDETEYRAQRELLKAELLSGAIEQHD